MNQLCDLPSTRFRLTFRSALPWQSPITHEGRCCCLQDAVLQLKGRVNLEALITAEFAPMSAPGQWVQFAKEDVQWAIAQAGDE